MLKWILPFQALKLSQQACRKWIDNGNKYRSRKNFLQKKISIIETT